MRKTNVRIVGDPDLSVAVRDHILEGFDAEYRGYPNAPTRYSRSESPGCSIYMVIKGRKT